MNTHLEVRRTSKEQTTVQREPHNLIIRLKLLPRRHNQKETKRKRKKGEGCPMGFDSRPHKQQSRLNQNKLASYMLLVIQK